MQPFTDLTAIAAPLPIPNVDTDMIVPARFLTTVTRAGLGAALFATQRADPTFVLNRAPWSSAGIIVAVDNFGCGSSREHAPWALIDFGIRVVIAPSIADIFYNNCCKNGILPIVLPHEQIDELMHLASDPSTAQMRIDLPHQTIAAGNRSYQFEIDAARKSTLLAGANDISRSLAAEGAIAAYENRRMRVSPWLPAISQATMDGIVWDCRPSPGLGS